MIFVTTSWFKKINGLVLWPFLFLRNPILKDNPVFINHEKIHERQQLELLVIFFLIWYLFEYIILRLRYKHDRAYRNIVFEREAYTMERDLHYLKKRTFWSFLKFYKSKYAV